MALDPIDSPVLKCAIFGRTASQSAVSTVRLLQLYGSHLVDVPVTDAKAFQFTHLECGTCILIAMSGKQYLGTQMVTATVAGTRVELKP